MLCSANKQLICIGLEQKRASSWTQFQIIDDHQIIGCTLVRLIHLVWWDLNRIIWQRRRCALSDILSSGSGRSAQKVSAADRSGFTAPRSCQRELLEEHLWVYNLSLWVEKWMLVASPPHTRAKNQSMLGCARARSPSTTGRVVRRSLPRESKESLLLSCAKSNTCDSERTHTHPGVHCSEAVKLQLAVMSARWVLVCLLAD